MRINITSAQGSIKVSPKEVRRLVRKTLFLENNCSPGEINIILIDDAQMKELNLLYSGRFLATDVISFDDSINSREILADIAVSTQTALRQARVFRTTPVHEVYLYIIHGLLHLLGYDDKGPRQRRVMNKRAEYILEGK